MIGTRSLGVLLAIAGVGMAVLAEGDPSLPPAPDIVYGELFADVQRARIFPDQKTFPDCVARGNPRAIAAGYAALKARTGAVDLAKFIGEHFIVPEIGPPAAAPSSSLEGHLAVLWNVLTRTSEKMPAGSSLLPLPGPYVAPGGRFRELYYWDSYFTMLGLRVDGRDDLVRSMVDDFAFEAAAYGFMPNGNRNYYLSRSQPPLFSLMLGLLDDGGDSTVLVKYLPALRAEEAYWADRSYPTRHVVRLPDGGFLDRYFDRLATPRPEAYADDEALSRASKQPPAALYRNLRSAAESGWDFSSRWMADRRTLASIDTTDILPVDLNCMLCNLEIALGRACGAAGDSAMAAAARRAANLRKAEILRDCWSARDGFFFDFDLTSGRRRPDFTLAGVAPLFFRIATQAQADAVAETVRRRFLRPGGVVTTLERTGQQWDAPNGWAPLEWITIQGLENYGHHDLAAEIARRWMKLNRDVYRRTGRMEEKYNVEDTSLPGGGGEYPSQDGFGWTNGVFLKLDQVYGRQNQP